MPCLEPKPETNGDEVVVVGGEGEGELSLIHI